MDAARQGLVMGAVLALWHNAHRERQLAELLAEHACTTAGVVRELGVSANDVEHIVARLRANGLPVATVDVGDDSPLYRILYPAGRVCAATGCTTILRRSNPADTCELHGGGVLTVTQRAPARPEPSRVDWRGLRDLWGLSQGEWARRANVNAGFLSCIERGLQHPSRDVARRHVSRRGEATLPRLADASLSSYTSAVTTRGPASAGPLVYCVSSWRGYSARLLTYSRPRRTRCN